MSVKVKSEKKEKRKKKKKNIKGTVIISFLRHFSKALKQKALKKYGKIRVKENPYSTI